MSNLSQPPNPQEAAKKLRKAIQSNKPADWLLYQTLKDAKVTIGAPPVAMTFHVWGSFNQNLHEYKEAWLILTSPEGRRYIREQLDSILDYIEELVKTP